MIYRDEYAFFRKEILTAQKTGNCFHMANEECSLKLLDEGKEEFPELIMYQIGSEQFFCVNKKARKKFKEFLLNRISKREKELEELHRVLQEMDKEDNKNGRNKIIKQI